MTQGVLENDNGDDLEIGYCSDSDERSDVKEDKSSRKKSWN